MPGLASEITFEIPKELISHKDIVLKSEAFTNKELEFIESLIITAEKEKTSIDDKFDSIFFKRDALIKVLIELDRAHTKSLVTLRVSHLKKRAALKTITRRTESKKIFIHKLGSLKDIVALPKIKKVKEKNNSRRRTKEMIVVQCDLLKADNYTILSGNSQDKAYHERLINGIVDVAMRLSSRDSRTEITVKTEIAGSPLTIVSKTIGNNSELLKLSDQRCQRAILSLVKNEIDVRVAKLKGLHNIDYPEDPYEEFLFRKEKIDNLFAINIYDLCKEIGLPRKYNNAVSVMKMMERLANTVYDIDSSENEWFRKVYSISGKSDLIRIQFLQNFEVSKEPDQFLDLFGIQPNTLLPHLYTFSLDPRSFYMLLDPEKNSTYLSHKEMFRENSGLVQRTYNWSRAFIGGTDKDYIDGKKFDLHEMHSKLIPATRYDNFYHYFIRMLKRFCIGGDDNWNQNGVSKSAIYGYIFTFDNTDGKAEISIKRDPEDPIVGDKSEHQRLLRVRR